MKKICLFLIFCTAFLGSFGQVMVKEIPDSYCISPMEYKLYKMINDYRRRYDLPSIPLSKSLCFVASSHVKDLFLNHPDQEPCNFHSWSDKGSWKPFCYPRDEKKNNSVWDKPRELTNYKGKGFEIVYWENSEAVIDSIIAFWKSIDYFNSFLMNTGKWQGKKWNAIGIGIYENYAVAWFGELPDSDGTPWICGTERPKKTAPQVKAETEPQPGDSVTPPPPPPAKKGKPEPKPKKEIKKPEQKKDSLNAVPKPLKVPVPVEEAGKGTPTEGNYFIIVKSQFPMAEMKKSLSTIISQGYPEAKLLDRNNKLRLSIMDFSEKGKADSALREVKKTFKDAWLFRY